MSFYEQLRRENASLWEAAFKHPFVRGIGRGDLPEEKFRFYLEQDYLFLIDYARVFALAVAKADGLETMGYLAKVVEGTLNYEMELHRQVCADFGLSREDLERATPAPTTDAYTRFLLSVAWSGSLAEILAAVLPCAYGYREIGLRLAEAGLPEHPHYAAWIETYSGDEYGELAEWLRRTFDELADLAGPAERGRMHLLFRRSSQYELRFWEMAWRGEAW